MGSIGSGRTYHVGAAGKCEHWRSIDLADLKRMGLLKPIAGGNIRAIVWHAEGRVDRLGVIPEAKGVRFKATSLSAYRSRRQSRSGARRLS